MFAAAFTMAITKCGKLWKQPVVALPDFLIPSFQNYFPGARRSFASSAPRPSRVGKAAIALPPDVNLRLLDPPKRKGAITRVEPPKTVEIEGPLGTKKLSTSLQSSSYMNQAKHRSNYRTSLVTTSTMRLRKLP